MNRADTPSQAHQHVVQLVSAPRAGVLVVCFLGPYRGLLTHYTKGESLPCAGEADCPQALHKTRSTWKGYAPVRWYNPSGDWWLPAVVEITECLEELLRGRELAGEVWELARAAGKRRTRPVEGRYIETRPVHGVFETFDVLPVLQRRYHTRQLVMDVPNPVVPRVVLPAIAAPPPGSRNGTAAAAPEVAPTGYFNRLRKEAGAAGLVGKNGNGKE